MKKIIALMLALVMILSMAACSSESGKEKDDDESEITETTTKSKKTEKTEKKDPDTGKSETTTTTEAVKVDEGLLTVEVTLDASFFEGNTADEIMEGAKESGYEACKINDNGSVTYTMTKAKHAEMLLEFQKTLDETFDGLVDGEDAVESFKKIVCNEDYSVIDIYVDPEKYTSWDNLYAMIFYMGAAYYQAFAGTAQEDIDVAVNFIDQKTDKVLSTASYKEFIANNEDLEELIPDERPTVYDAPVIAEKENITIADNCEFSIDYTNITYDVMPLNPASWYTHYMAEDGKVYVDICVSWKNLATKEIMADEIMEATLVFGGKYEYHGFTIIETENRGDFGYTNITSVAPLASEYIHYLFEVPEEVASGDGSVFVLLTIGGNTYKVMVREGAEGDIASVNENAQAKSDGEVKTGEVISIAKKCEFFIDYTNITDDVMPPFPGDWYTHYEAEDGRMYIDLCIGYHSLKAKDEMADDILSATLIFAGKYEYTGFSMIEEESRGDFTYSNITAVAPLTTEYIHYLFEVPEDVAASEGSFVIRFTIGGNTYETVVREGSTGEVIKVNPSAVMKKNGAVKLQEVVAVPGTCEFFVDYTDITDDVMPLYPGDWYSHYEADSGKVYVDFCVGYKNWKNKNVGADDVMAAELIYDGKYEYKGFSMIEEEGRSDFTYSNITSIAPLTTEYLHFLFEVPEEVENSSAGIQIVFTAGGNTYTYTIR